MCSVRLRLWRVDAKHRRRRRGRGWSAVVVVTGVAVCGPGAVSVGRLAIVFLGLAGLLLRQCLEVRVPLSADGEGVGRAAVAAAVLAKRRLAPERDEAQHEQRQGAHGESDKYGKGEHCCAAAPGWRTEGGGGMERCVVEGLEVVGLRPW